MINVLRLIAISVLFVSCSLSSDTSSDCQSEGKSGADLTISEGVCVCYMSYFDELTMSTLNSCRGFVYGGQSGIEVLDTSCYKINISEELVSLLKSDKVVVSMDIDRCLYEKGVQSKMLYSIRFSDISKGFELNSEIIRETNSILRLRNNFPDFDYVARPNEVPRVTVIKLLRNSSKWNISVLYSGHKSLMLDSLTNKFVDYIDRSVFQDAIEWIVPIYGYEFDQLEEYEQFERRIK